MFRFAHTYFLYLLILIPVFTVLLVVFLVWRKKALARFGDMAIIGQLMPEYSPGRLILKFILLMIAFVFLVIALADPQTGSKLEKVQRKGIDLMIALDVSNSMLAQDIKPDRLERSKQAISKLVDKLEGDRIGIVIFAGKAYTQLPITTDYAAAKLFLSAITTGSVPTQGTAIADAIELCTAAFNHADRNKAIIVITDGEDHQGDVLEQSDAAAKKGISIYTIGMGLPDGAPIPVYDGNVQVGYKKDRDGSTIMSKLDEAMLQRIASVGNGLYVRANNSESGIQKLFDEINKIQKSEIESRQYSDYEDRFQYFLFAGLFFLVFEIFIFNRKNQWFSKFKPFES
jgi:Ca-activated chloride channel homolog